MSVCADQRRCSERQRKLSAQEDEKKPSQNCCLSTRTRLEADYNRQRHDQRDAEPARRRSSRAVKQVEKPDFIDITLPCLRFGHGGRGTQAMAFRKYPNERMTTQADRQRDRQTNRQRDTGTDTDGQGQTDKHAHTHTHRQANGRTNRQTKRHTESKHRHRHANENKQPPSHRS